jgi:hypothetical protein
VCSELGSNSAVFWRLATRPVTWHQAGSHQRRADGRFGKRRSAIGNWERRASREALPGLAERQREAATLIDLNPEHAGLGAKGWQNETEVAPIHDVVESIGTVRANSTLN